MLPIDKFFEIVTLVLVMAGIFGLTWLTTRFLAKRLPGGGKSSHMQIVERLSLGKDRQVALIKVGNEHFMVGIAGQHISFSQPVQLDSKIDSNQPNYSEIQEKVNNDHGIDPNG